jgi:hypothetical protein
MTRWSPRSPASIPEHSVARLTEADPTHPDLVRFREQAQRLRADARRPAELELAQLAEAGDDEATEARARALLARWPDSRIAGRILGGIQDRRRAGEAERLLASARSALSSGDTVLATELCRQARSVGADPADLLDRIREVEATRERTRQDAEVAAVCGQLAARIRVRAWTGFSRSIPSCAIGSGASATSRYSTGSSRSPGAARERSTARRSMRCSRSRRRRVRPSAATTKPRLRCSNRTAR